MVSAEHAPFLSIHTVLVCLLLLTPSHQLMVTNAHYPSHTHNHGHTNEHLLVATVVGGPCSKLNIVPWSNTDSTFTCM